MNIVILAGGTGSIALQTGLYKLLDENLEGVDTKVIVNAYDNGLSTGAVRQVMGGQILGPSDVRKNQTTRLSLEDPNSPWLKFLNIRFTEPTTNAQNFCMTKIAELEVELNKSTPRVVVVERTSDRGNEVMSKTQLLREAVQQYFQVSVANKIDYNDFSLANIIYAGFAKANGNSLRAAAKIMASLMGIKDNVILNDDSSMFLGAITKSGKRITDEGDIVSWGNLEDPFVDIFFTDAVGDEVKPMLCGEAEEAIYAADLIILSSGTQWSSLIPTYASLGFAFALRNCKAKILMVMNKMPDKDSPGQSASDIIDVLVPKYIPENRLHVILDSNGHEIMKQLNNKALSAVASAEQFNMQSPAGDLKDSKTHDPFKLARAIAQTYFKEYINSNYFVFDYDDTLVGRGNAFPKASATNVRRICGLNAKGKVAICTGNSIKAVNIHSETELFDPNTYHAVKAPLLPVYADGGVNRYLYDTSVKKDDSDDGVSHQFDTCVNKDVLIKTHGSGNVNDIIRLLRDNHIPLSKIENRGNAIISIKPIDQEYRPMVVKLIELITQGQEFIVRSAGRTTIEIVHPDLSKIDAIKHIMKTVKPAQITYVGDELERGNDSPVKNIAGVKCLSVKSPVETAFFLLTLSIVGQ